MSTLPRPIAACLLAASLALAGCSSTPKHVGRQDAVAVAVHELNLRGWSNLAVDDAGFRNGQWRIVISQMPAGSGGTVTVVVSPQGKVIDTFPGRQGK
jgi:hypothetical protein